MLKPLKDRAVNHLMSLRGGEWGESRRLGNVLGNALMGSAMVKERDILVEDPPRMALAENQNLIQAFAANRAEEPFAEVIAYGTNTSYSELRTVSNFDKSHF